jgi:Holliday junction DNA helicase RuvB
VLKRVRDFAQEKTAGVIDLESAQTSMALLNLDERGLDDLDRQILRTIIDKFRGGPVGIETIAASIGEESQTIEEVYEPYLLQEGFMQRTRRGREVTDAAYNHLGIEPTSGNRQQKLI